MILALWVGNNSYIRSVGGNLKNENMSVKEILALTLMFNIGMVCLKGQQSNDFETEYEMPIMIDTTNQSNIWQIGIPSKSIFSEALSEPNALITDTLNIYPINNQSSFYFKINMSTLWTGLPYFMVLWNQKMDCEIGKDGGVIEVSYDSMQTWVNIFEDMVYQPITIGNVNNDTLFNGEMGISEIDTTWKEIGFCWSSVIGNPVDEIFIRFTFHSDSIDSFQEGWIIDNFEAFPTIVDNVEELVWNRNERLTFEVYPNPSSNQITLKRKGEKLQKVIIQIIDIAGIVVYQRANSNSKEVELDISLLNTGTYVVVLRNERGVILGTERIIKTTANKG